MTADPITDALADIDDLLDTPIEDRGHADTHYRLLSIAAKLRAAQDRDPRGASHVEEATVHSPLPTPGVTPRHISALWQVEGELRGASDLIFRTGSTAIIENARGVLDLLTTNADRLEGVLNEVSGGHDRTNNNPRE